MDAELKPCPFCGEEAGICEANDICFHRDDDGNKIFGGWRCFCPSCAIEQIGYETREEAVSAWNNRSTEHATHRAPVDEKGGGRMTGIERLRELAGAWDEWGLGGTLAEMADEIDRELREERDRWESDLYEAQVEWNRVAGVCLEMERRCLYNEDTVVRDVETWARELRHAMKSDASDECGAQNPSCTDAAEAADVTSEAPKVTRDPAEDVSMSAYDLLPKEEREAIAWVREHGGLSHVKEEWNHSRNLKRSLETAQAKVERQQRHIESLQGKLSERRVKINVMRAQVADMRPRLMPYGCEWPRYESGELVGFGDEASRIGEVFAICLYCDGSFSLNFRSYRKGELVKRSTPKVLDADGVEIRVGDVLYSIETGDSVTVDSIEPGNPWFATTDGILQHCAKFTHRAPVLAADGRPLREGETVWNVKTGERYVVGAFAGDCVNVSDGRGGGLQLFPSQLTHTKPEIDSWERISRSCEGHGSSVGWQACGEGAVMAEYVVEYKDEGMYATCTKERVVRCRDCRRSFEERGELWCRGIVGPPVEPDGFCAWGEGRNGN